MGKRQTRCDFILKPIEISDDVKKYYQTVTDSADVKPLVVKVAATHSGKVTKNKGFYLPAKMRDGAKSFTDQYSKPILVHHDARKDAIGRVISAEYVDISSGIGSLRDAIVEVTDFDKFNKGQMTLKDQARYASKHLLDLKIVDDPAYHGLGYIQLTISVTDLDAINKILDGRYLTGSVGATTDAFICSVCKTDWAEEGACEHSPGEVYDGTLCVMIAGNLVYDEWSFVNKPADIHSRVLSVGYESNTSITNSTDLTDSMFEISFTQRVEDFQEDKTMTFQKANELLRAKYAEAQIDIDVVKKLVDENKNVSDEEIVALFDATLAKEEPASVADAEKEPVVQDTETSVEEEPAKPSVEDQLASALARIEALESAKAETVVPAEPVVQDSADNKEVDFLHEIALLEQENLKLKDRVTVLQKENRYLLDDIKNLDLSLSDMIENVKLSKVSHLKDLHRLTGSEVSVEDFVKSVDTLSDAQLNEQVESLSASVDIGKITDMLTSGLARNPEGTVEDTIAEEDNTVRSDKIEIPGNVRVAYFQIKNSYGVEQAEKFLADWKESVVE